MILTGYIGRLSVSQISAYGISSRIYGIYFALFKGFAIGTMVVFAKAYGTGQKGKAYGIYRQSMSVVMPVAIIMAAVVWLAPQLILMTMSNDASLLEMGASYLRYAAPVFPLLCFVHINSACFQADGDTKVPLYIATVGNAVSIILGYVLIIGIGSWGGLGLEGAAITNSIRIIVMTCAGMALLFGRNGKLALDRQYADHENAVSYRELLRCTIPTAIGNSFWNFATVFISADILSYGQDYYAAYQLGLQAEGFCNTMAAGFMTAAMSLAGKAIGSGDSQMLKQSYHRLDFYCIVISCINVVFLLTCSDLVMHLLTDKQILIDIAHVYLVLMIFSQYAEMKSKVTYGYIRSAGYTTVPTIFDVVGIWGVRVVGCYVIGIVLHLDIVWIWWIINADQWVRCVMSIAFCRMKNVVNILEEKNDVRCESCHI